jgi:hypothetical protein
MRTRLSIARFETHSSEPSAKNKTTQSSCQLNEFEPDVRGARAPNASKAVLECLRPRRSAVEGELLRYLGILAKKDPEGFAYPSIARIAEKIERTRCYLQQRIQFLESVGRLIPTRRVRHGRELKGWIVVRYGDWVQSQSRQAGVAPASNNLEGLPKSLPKTPNNLGSPAAKTDHKSLTVQPDERSVSKRRFCSGMLFKDDCPVGSQSQFTSTATATTKIRRANGSLKSKKESQIDRLLAKNLRDKETLQQVRQKYLGTVHEDLLDVIPPFREACKFLAFSIDEDDPSLTWDFCALMRSKWAEYKSSLQDGVRLPSKFCSQLIDSCLEGDVHWPPSFQEHRDRLREAEKTDRLTFRISERSNAPPICLSVDPKSLPRKKEAQL